MAKNIWDDATGVTYNQVQAGKIKKPGAPGQADISAIAAPPAAPVNQPEIPAPAAPPVMPPAESGVAPSGGFNRTFNPATDSPDNVGRARAANIEAAKQGMVSMPAPVPSMETPQGIATNMAMNPTPAAAPQTIMDIRRPVNQPQAQRAELAPSPVEQPLPAALDPFAYRGGYPEGSPKGPSNGPDSKMLSPEQSPGYTIGRGQAEAERIRGANAQILANSPSSARTQETANRNEADLQGRQGAYMVTNNLQSFEDKGNGVVRQVGADGKTMITNVGTAGVTDPGKQVPVNSFNGSANNESMARANAIRQQMIDSQPMGGIAVLPDYAAAENAEKTQRWAIDDMASRMKSAGTRTERAAYGQMMQTMMTGQNALATEAMRGQNQLTAEQGRNAVQMRGQNMTAQQQAAQMAGNPLDNRIKQNQVAAGEMSNAAAKQVMDLQSAYQAETDPTKRAAISENIRALSGKDTASKFLTVQGGEFTDPDNPLAKMKSPSSIFDTSTRQFIPQPGQQNQAAGQVNKTAGGPVAPKVNEVRGGHRYIGGNPADPKSWEKA